jgi:uncharacterized protein YukE
VTALPKAINLIGIQGGGELLLPRFYLYYSTSSGIDPICDITVDDIPILNGWNTVRSANKVDPYVDICNQVDDIYSKMAHGVANTIYASQLAGWANGIKNYFDVEEEEQEEVLSVIDLSTYSNIVKGYGAAGTAYTTDFYKMFEAISRVQRVWDKWGNSEMSKPFESGYQACEEYIRNYSRIQKQINQSSEYAVKISKTLAGMR